MADNWPVPIAKDLPWPPWDFSVVSKIDVKIRRVPGAVRVALPVYETAGAAGADIHAAVEPSISIDPGERLLVPTGFALEVPRGFEAQIRPRSGLAKTYGVTVANAPGTIDSDYRGEVGVLLVNLSRERFVIVRGMRIAQMVFAPVSLATFREVDALGDTARGAGGFGSTGE